LPMFAPTTRTLLSVLAALTGTRYAVKDISINTIFNMSF
jgi:hypothetical protein